jgi:urease beta subunit
MRRAPILSCLLWTVTVAACGDDAIRRLGDAGLPSTELSLDTIVVEDGECGAQPAPKSLSFVNTGDGPLEWTATIEGAGFTITEGASGSAEPGDTATLTVQPDAVPTSAAVGQMIEAMLVVQTNARTEPFTIPLSLQVHGGSLLVETPTIGFGQIQVSVPAGATPLTIRNQGDRAIQVALGAPATTEFSATWDGAPNAATIEPGEALVGASSNFTPADEGTRTDAVAIVATGPVCAGDVANVSLGGEGTFAQIGVTPGNIAYGTTPCGSTATTRNVTIQNNYNVAITYTAAVMTGPYSIAQGNQSGSIAANSSITVPVAATAVPRLPASLTANSLDGTVRITTSAPGHSPATITLDQAASGAVLALAPASGSTVAFGNVVAGSPESQSYSVTNSGSIAATVTVAATGSGFSAVVPGTGSIAANNTAATASITQTVAARGAQTGTFTLSTSTNRCQAGGATVGTLNLTATAQAPVASIGTVPAMAITCGGGVSSTVSIAVSNTGDTPLTLSSHVISSGFTLMTTLPLTIAAGQSANVQVRATAAVIGTDRGGTPRTGTLSFTTNEIGAPTRTVNLSAAVNGANIDFEFPMGTRVSSMQFTAAGQCPADRLIYIRNSGNQTLQFLAWGSPQPNHFRFTNSSPASFLAAGAFTSTTITVWSPPDNACEVTAAEQMPFATSGTNVCTTRVTNVQGVPEARLPLTYRITGLTNCFCT